jgi:hypothetical protein
MNELSEAMARVESITGSNLPKSHAESYPSPKPQEVKVSQLTKLNKPKGSPPKGKGAAWSIIQRHKDKLAERWTQLHLINEEKFGGPGTEENLVPGPQSINDSTQMRGFDTTVSTVFEEDLPNDLLNVIWIKATVSYWSGLSRIRDTDGTQISWEHFANRMNLVMGLNTYNRTSSDWITESKTRVSTSIPIPKPDFSTAISLNTATTTVLERSGIAVFSDPAYGSTLCKFIRENQEFATWTDLETKLRDAANNPRGNRPYKALMPSNIDAVVDGINEAKDRKEIKLT